MRLFVKLRPVTRKYIDMTTLDTTTVYDVEAIRADFPILSQMHSEKVPLIYLDNAATSQKPNSVIQAIDQYYREYNANVPE
jgi:cysteine desulfurase/selenocysteine lyase